MPRYRLYFLLTLILIAVFPFRLLIHEHFHKPLLDEYVNGTFEGKGVVVDEPEEKTYYTEVIVKISDIPRTQKILVQAPFYPDYEYGDEVMVKGKLKRPKDFVTQAGHTFHYQKYLAKDDIYYLLSDPTITLLSKHRGSPVKEILFNTKHSFIDHIRKVLPRPESSLLAGMLIAGKGGLGTQLENQFKEVGLIHIVVLSGYNVTIVAEAFISLLSFLPRFISYGCGALGIILFTIMAGGGSTIIRASFMSIVALIGKLTGNQYSALRALLVGGFAMIMWNPLILQYDPSFQLSFLATFALIVFSTPLQKRLGRFGESFIGEILSSTFAVEFFLLPYLLYMNGRFSLVSLPANLLVLSFIPFTMLTGFIATVSSYLSLFISYPFSFVSFVMLHYILSIVSFADKFSFIAIKL